MPSRKLAAPAVAWKAAMQTAYERGARKNPPEIPPMKALGVPLVDGYCDVDEALTYTTSAAAGGTVVVPLWHVLVRDLHFQDVTAPEIAPVFPLPPDKEHRKEADRLAAGRLEARAARALVGRR